MKIFEIHRNHGIPNENNENHKVPLGNHENHANIRMLCLELHARIMKIMKIIEFHMRINKISKI